ncbi:hypothetical protein BO70DRAFT_341942 [Aspergillus heteromorphus CBS 117.55]|uniref:Glycine amidinotransferase, mitochondrial n=1 Tax=Aspergillus heteromorphus CBS 117.55 TaxID=1448321 RepID=A0A317VGA4_9EURO|nr:uncharacterized protein BO70DRAFT_341942 [Aspergillus heteromorphus CBS 117.55]PWY72945.1 hypothetical protein BO70DRAFT_341942 [Aspergillus heteromorphus CBS 117.55]
MASPPPIHADNEWSPLKSILVGRAGDACFPPAPKKMIEATMPLEHRHHFVPNSPFPKNIVTKAEQELDQFARILTDLGIEVHRSTPDIDWAAENGYTGAMPRDGLMSVGNTLIEACFAWPCRAREIDLAYGSLLKELGRDPRVRVVRRPEESFAETLLDEDWFEGERKFVINESRPAFDTADFMRIGKTILGQYSHVTNRKGVEYLRSVVPEGYTVEMVETDDDKAMHIDATICPLREGLLAFNPERVTEAELRSHEVLREWDLRPCPFRPVGCEDPPGFMASGWLCLNVLVLDGRRVVVEESDGMMASWLEELGMEVILCPFRNVNSIGGSFHCATVDLVRVDGE